MIKYEIRQFFARGPAIDGRLRVNGIGVDETMSPGYVNRPGGTGDWLLMFFPQPTMVGTGSGIVSMPESTLMIWPWGCGHFYGCPDQEWGHSWIHCDGSFVAQALLETGLPPGSGYRCTQELINRWLRLMFAEITEQPPDDADILQGMFLLMLKETARMNRTSPPAIPLAAAAARSYIERHYREPLQLKQIAAFCHLSVPHLCSQFQRHYQISPINYAIELRLREATHLLTDYNRKLADVAAATGFSDLYYFCRLFRQRKGMSPGAWRKSRQQQADSGAPSVN